MWLGGRNVGGMGGMIGVDGEIDENFWVVVVKEREGGECVGDGMYILFVYGRYNCC